MRNEIKLKAMCIFQKGGQVLVSKGLDKVKNETFYRFLGGHIDFFETAEDGIRREIKEELGSEIENLKLLEMIENLFIYKGEKCHEVDFIFSGNLVRKELYEQNPIHVVEDTYEFDAHWVSIKDLISSRIPLYPKFNYQELFKPKS